MSYLEQAKRAAARLGRNRSEPAATIPGRETTLQAADPGFPDAVARLTGMHLGQFQSQGQPFEVRLPWHSETLWFVPAEADARKLVQAGISRGRLWTARELRDLLAIQGLSRVHVRTIAVAKLEFGGDVVGVHLRGGSP